MIPAAASGEFLFAAVSFAEGVVLGRTHSRASVARLSYGLGAGLLSPCGGNALSGGGGKWAASPSGIAGRAGLNESLKCGPLGPPGGVPCGRSPLSPGFPCGLPSGGVLRSPSSLRGQPWRGSCGRSGNPCLSSVWAGAVGSAVSCRFSLLLLHAVVSTLAAATIRQPARKCLLFIFVRFCSYGQI